MVQGVTGVVGPSVAASCHIVLQKVYDAAFEVGSKAVWNFGEQTGTQTVDGALELRHVSTCHQPRVTKDGIQLGTPIVVLASGRLFHWRSAGNLS